MAASSTAGCYLAHERDGTVETPGDGPWLVYAAAVDDHTEVRATRLGGPTVIVDAPLGVGHGSWAPSARLLALVVWHDVGGSELELVRFDAEGPTLERRLPLGEELPWLAWSSSSRYLAVHRPGGPLWVVDVERGTEPVIVSAAPIRRIEWSPTDDLALATSDSFVAIARAADAFVLRRVALSDADLGSDEAWSAGGLWLLLRARDGSGLGRRLYATTADAGDPILVTPPLSDIHPSAGNAHWSPDARRLLYRDTAPGRPTLRRPWYVNELGGTGPIEVAPDGATASWSSADRIVAVHEERGPITVGSVVDLGPSGALRSERFRRELSCLAVVPSPDGRSVLLQLHDRPRTILAVWEPEGGAPRDLASFSSAFPRDADGWSPDGARFLVVVEDDVGRRAWELVLATGVARPVSGEVRRFSTGTPGPSPWSPDSEAHFLVLPDSGLALRDVRTDEIRELAARDADVIGWQRVPSP